MERGGGGDKERLNKKKQNKEWDLLVIKFQGFETQLSNNCYNQDSCIFSKHKLFYVQSPR